MLMPGDNITVAAMICMFLAVWLVVLLRKNSRKAKKENIL